MPGFPTLSGEQVVRIFEDLGCRVARQRGSHVILTKEGEMVALSVLHHREVAKGTLRSLIRSAGLTVNGFLRADKSYP